MKRLTKRFEEDGRPYWNIKGGSGEAIAEAHTKALYRLAELEDKLESGQLVELPQDKWCITTGHNADESLNYLVEHQNPVAEFWNGKWHIGMEEIKWRPILEKYDTKEEAEARLKELQEG